MKYAKLSYMLFIFISFILLISLGSAKLTLLENIYNTYNLGESIVGSVKIENIAEGYYVLGASLSCSSFKIDFLKSAKDLESGKSLDVVFPDIPVNKKMTGACTIKFSIEDFEGKLIESVESRPFAVSDKIDLNFSVDKLSYLSGEIIGVYQELLKLTR